MPSINFDSRSLLVSGRRFFMVGAGLEYPSLMPEEWMGRLRTLHGLGFNTVVSSCPWHLHAPAEGRTSFDGRLDLARFLTCASDVGLSVVLKIGPVVGPPYDGGGLPTWLAGDDRIPARSGAPEFMNLASRWFATVAEQMVGHQGDQDGGGPVVAVQIENDWRCGSEDAARAYLLELTRFARERGITVPILTSNGFWSPIENAIETWSGWDDLFSNVRQVGGLQPDRPRVCFIDRSMQESGLRRSELSSEAVAGEALVGRMAQVIAAGGQPIVAHAVAGRFSSGAVGRDDFGAISPDPFVDVLIDEQGDVTDLGRRVGRIARFARDFGSLLSDLDPDDRPLVMDPQSGESSIVIPREGGGGSMVLAFRGGDSDCATVVDREGRRFPMEFGDDRFEWRVFDADLAGQGRLDYASATPLALIRNILFLGAAARTDVDLSIDGRPISIRTPEGRRGLFTPVVEEHGDLCVVVVPISQRGGIIETDDGVLVGALDIDGRGEPIFPDGVTQVHQVGWTGKVGSIKGTSERSIRSRRPSDWSVWNEPDPRRTDHPRSIIGADDLGLASINAGIDHAWFTAPIQLPDARARRLRFLGGSTDVKAWLDQELLPPIEDGWIDIKGGKGCHTLALFVGHESRRVEGVPAPSDGDAPGDLVALKPLAGVSRSKIDHPSMDPFKLTGFVPNAADGERTSSRGLELAFQHRRRSELVLEIEPGSAGVLVLNDEPLAVFGTGGFRCRLSSARPDSIRAGKNRIVALPLEHIEEAGTEVRISLYEIVEEFIAHDAWRIRRWEPAPDTRIGHWNGVPKRRSDAHPHWVRGSVAAPKRDGVSVSVRLEGLTQGRIRVNGVDLGGYSNAISRKKGQGRPLPTEVAVPSSVTMREDRLTIEIFDERGANPENVAVRYSTPTGS